MEYYTSMFQSNLKRNPTNVELFDIAQSNSEHSRHWFFKADLFVDGEKMPHKLFDLVKAPLEVRALPAAGGAHHPSRSCTCHTAHEGCYDATLGSSCAPSRAEG